MEDERRRRKGPAPPLENGRKQRKIQRQGQEPLRQALYGISGSDLASIDGIGVETALTLVSEHGVDLSGIATEKKFIQYLRLAPNRPTSGGKRLKRRSE